MHDPHHSHLFESSTSPGPGVQVQSTCPFSKSFALNEPDLTGLSHTGSVVHHEQALPQQSPSGPSDSSFAFSSSNHSSVSTSLFSAYSSSQSGAPIDCLPGLEPTDSPPPSFQGLQTSQDNTYSSGLPPASGTWPPGSPSDPPQKPRDPRPVPLPLSATDAPPISMIKFKSGTKRLASPTREDSKAPSKNCTKRRPTTAEDPTPFHCDTCGKKYARAEFLRRHIRTHENIRPWSCTCGKTFGRSDTCNRHRRICAVARTETHQLQTETKLKSTSAAATPTKTPKTSTRSGPASTTRKSKDMKSSESQAVYAASHSRSISMPFIRPDSPLSSMSFAGSRSPTSIPTWMNATSLPSSPPVSESAGGDSAMPFSPVLHSHPHSHMYSHSISYVPTSLSSGPDSPAPLPGWDVRRAESLAPVPPTSSPGTNASGMQDVLNQCTSSWALPLQPDVSGQRGIDVLESLRRMLEADAGPRSPIWNDHATGRTGEQKPSTNNGLSLSSTKASTGPETDVTIFPTQSTANEQGNAMVLPGTSSSATDPAVPPDTFGLGMYFEFAGVDDQSTTPVSPPIRDEVKTPSSGELFESTPKHEHPAGEYTSSFWGSDTSVQDKSLDRPGVPSFFNSGSHHPSST